MTSCKQHPTDRRLAASVLRIAAMGTLFTAFTLGSVELGAKPDGASLVGHGSSGVHAMPASVAVQSAADAGGSQLASSFSIAGSVAGLFPGETLPLVLSVSNPQKVSITVTSISTTVSKASSGCVAANVKVTSFSGHHVVGAGKTGKVTVKVTMRHSAPNACQGAHFPFQYTGLATAA